jgi:hypothetical protein
MILLGTSKNAGLAAGLALTLFTRETAVPSTVQTISMLTYVIYLDLRMRNRRNIAPLSPPDDPPLPNRTATNQCQTRHQSNQKNTGKPPPTQLQAKQ